MRIHGTTAARLLEVFTEHEAAVLLPVPAVYDVPLFRSVKVHWDHHVEILESELRSLEHFTTKVQARARIAAWIDE